MRNTMEVKNILESIKATTKVKVKQQIILDNKDNALFMETLNFLCNPFITTGISKGKMSRNVNGVTKTTSLSEAMKYIANNNTGRDEDIAYVMGFIDSQDLEASEFLKDLFAKSYSIGIGASGINKVIPKFIPEFDVMLAESYDKNKERVNNQNIIITLKLDGMRVICINEKQEDKNEPKFYSRQGHIIEGLNELEEEFKNLPTGIYDGELIADGKFSTSKELFQETMKRSRVKGVKSGLRMYCFDYIEHKHDFESGIDTTPCTERKQKLKAILSNSNGLVKYLNPLYEGNDTSMISKAVQYAAKAQQEGVMLNIADAPYECKRTKNLLKVKVFNTVDLKVIGYEEGQGEFVGTLGALLVDYKGYTVKVGSGYSQDLRKEIWDNKDNIIGSIIEVKYFEETQNQNGGLSLRFPVFIRIRDDKDEPSLH